MCEGPSSPAARAPYVLGRQLCRAGRRTTGCASPLAPPPAASLRSPSLLPPACFADGVLPLDMEASELLSDAFEVLSSKEIKLLAMRAKPDKDQLVEEEDLVLANVVMQEAQKKLISQVSVLLPEGACATPAPSSGCLPRPRLILPIGLNAHLGGAVLHLCGAVLHLCLWLQRLLQAWTCEPVAWLCCGHLRQNWSSLPPTCLSIVVPGGSVVEKGTFICQVTLKGA